MKQRECTRGRKKAQLAEDDFFFWQVLDHLSAMPLRAPVRVAAYIAAKLMFRQGLVHPIFPFYTEVKTTFLTPWLTLVHYVIKCWL